MKTDVLNKITRGANRFALKVKKHSPAILTTVGVVGVVVSGVKLCQATTKLSPILEEAKKNIDMVHEAIEAGNAVTQDPVTKELITVEYTPEDGKKDIAIYTAKAGLKLVKLYAPAVLIGVASIGCMVGSHVILQKRNVALAAAYTAVDKGFKAYRGRVVERLGEAMDRELLYGLKSQKIVEEVVDTETGEVTTVEKTVEVYDPSNHTPYCIAFDDGNTGWDKDPELTKFFLDQQQRYANDLLKTKGHLFLNEVYDMLGAPRTKAGNIVGWIYDEKNPIGDNFVDFGMYNVNNPKARDFINGRERVIILDFNVDGNILDLMP
jgi:xanthosine utilization system XapX-like protein